MNGIDCGKAREYMDLAFGEALADAEARALGAHAAACPACAEEQRRSQAALRLVGAFRDEDSAVPGEALRLDQIRTRAMAEIRAQASERGASRSWMGLAWPAAATVAAVALTAVLAPSPSPAPLALPGASPVASDAVASAAPSDDVDVVSVASSDGITLQWQSSGTSFLVLKSNKPSSFDDAEVTVVCGRSWTDREPSRGARFYRVVRAREHC